MCKGSIKLYIKTANRETRFCIGVIIDKDQSICHVCLSTWYPNQSSFFYSYFGFPVSLLYSLITPPRLSFWEEESLLFTCHQKKNPAGSYSRILKLFPGSVESWGVKAMHVLKEKENSKEVKGTGLSKDGKKQVRRGWTVQFKYLIIVRCYFQIHHFSHVIFNMLREQYNIKRD